MKDILPEGSSTACRFILGIPASNSAPGGGKYALSVIYPTPKAVN
jgi:hypothetical protein